MAAATENKHAARIAYEEVAADVQAHIEQGHDLVVLSALVSRTGHSPADVETAMGKLERRYPSQVQRSGGSGDSICWQITEA